jgi:hypothetical protein
VYIPTSPVVTFYLLNPSSLVPLVSLVSCIITVVFLLSPTFFESSRVLTLGWPGEHGRCSVNTMSSYPYFGSEYDQSPYQQQQGSNYSNPNIPLDPQPPIRAYSRNGYRPDLNPQDPDYDSHNQLPPGQAMTSNSPQLQYAQAAPPSPLQLQNPQGLQQNYPASLQPRPPLSPYQTPSHNATSEVWTDSYASTLQYDSRLNSERDLLARNRDSTIYHNGTPGTMSPYNRNSQVGSMYSSRPGSQVNLIKTPAGLRDYRTGSPQVSTSILLSALILTPVSSRPNSLE